MPGVHLEVVPITLFDFANMAQPNTSATIRFRRNIDITQYREITVITRVHSLPHWPPPAGTRFSVNFNVDAPTNEDPTFDVTAGGAQAAIIDSTVTAPAVLLYTFAAPTYAIGAFWEIVVGVTLGASGAGTATMYGKL